MQNDLKLFLKLMAVSFAVFIALVVISCNDKPVHSSNDACNYNMANDKNAFHVGDTLLPDYSHNDTLIVTDIASADSLNWLFDGVDLPAPATDSEIDSVLHKYCRTFYHTCKWKPCPYKGITSDQFGKSVAAYVGNSESDAYSLDMLHLYSPKAEYEELETMLRED